ncbi:MAG TPA: hypothetical protein VGM18_01310 [Candidatus Sulfotelmatobacter sp.]|jgi:hypothetical protein
MAKFGATHLDILFAFVLFFAGLGYSVSGFPASVIVACVIWGIAWLFVTHLFFVYDGTASCPIDVKVILWASATFFAVVVLWSPVARRYSAEHSPRAEPQPEQPSVTLRFTDPRYPVLAIDNISGAVARNVKWEVVLWDMDSQGRNDLNPLQIPTQTFDFIKARDESGFEEIFTPAIAASLRRGDRLFGTAVVDCPECKQGRTYVLYIVWGEGGWFSEYNAGAGKVMVPVKVTPSSLGLYFRTLENMVPKAMRIPIGKR